MEKKVKERMGIRRWIHGLSMMAKIGLTLGVTTAIILSVFAGVYVHQMSATVGVSTEVGRYLDSGCTTILPSSHSWGNVLDGDTVDFWIKNVGTVPVNVTITITGEVLCTVTPSPAFVSNLGRFATAKITLTINTPEPAGTSLTWSVDIDPIEA